MLHRAWLNAFLFFWRVYRPVSAYLLLLVLLLMCSRRRVGRTGRRPAALPQFGREARPLERLIALWAGSTGLGVMLGLPGPSHHPKTVFGTSEPLAH